MLEAGCEPDAVACGTLLCAYARWGRHKDMMLFYAAVRRRGILPPLSVFNYMISSLQKQKLHTKVIHVWNQMREASVPPNQFTYTVVISSYAKEGLLEEAMEVFAEMRRKKKFVPEEATYSLLISLSSKHSKGEQSLRLFEEMKGQGILPSNYTCASLLALYYKNEDYSKALSLFSEMERSKIVPDEVIYGILVRIYGKLGLYEDAQHTFEEIEEAGLLSDEQTYVAMAQVHMNVGNYDRALKVLESMKIRNVIYEAGTSKKARALILNMREKDFQFDEDLCMTVMEFYCKSSMIEDAAKLFKEIQRNGKPMKLTTMISLIEMYARNRIDMIQKEERPKALDATDSSAASMALKSLLDMPGGLSSACQLISKLARQGNKDEAKFLYEQLTALGAKLDDDSALATLIVQYGQHQQLERAQELFESASVSSSVGGHVYNAMVDALFKCGKIDKAHDLFMEMVDQGKNRDAVTISILVTHLTKHGKFQEAENIVHGCFRDEVQLDTVVYNTFIKLMLESDNQYNDKVDKCSENSCVIFLSYLFGCIMALASVIWLSVYGKGGKLDKAIETFSAAQELGRHQEASLLFNRMKESGINPGKISYNAMINAYATSGLHSEARIVFQQMQDSDLAPDSLSYLALIRAYTEGKLYKEAEDAIQMMLGSNITPSCPHFNHLIFAFLKEGQISEAQRIYKQMKDIGVAPDLACCRTMMRVYLEHGLVDEGISLFETTRESLKPDSFILSAVFHLYEHEGRELEAGEVLDAISLHGTTFLRNLKVGFKLRSKLEAS
ncbi:hypothetical protein PR202_gb18147 [Eleusine coracana subsp. coracana]|uniref:PROP1-like PPR domain-containing protein n=1 Tax=Eleusine coracana subsp. coracana TaxID=191504 RepID=A0AAV5F4I5_ELECO|nr:hypothetical protein PR202_gb18147 [Eleusine coracana subsp. coracana]